MPIQIRNLTHTYSPGSPFQATAIRDVNLTIQDGDFLALVGHTGSGKSTLVQHLNGLLTPSEGQVLVDGVDIGAPHTDRRLIRQKVGVVFQYPEYQLFEETVAKDIAFGPKNLGLPPDEIDARVRRAMAHVHLDWEKYHQRSPFDLSGGQMRRVAIAGVLAMESPYLVLDEPTAGLDPRGRDRILNMIRQLHQQGNVTVVMVSHSMDDVARMATRVVVMSKGAVVADDTPRAIFRQREMMEKIGLGVPSAAILRDALRERGIPVPEDAYTLEELQTAILACQRKEGGSHAEKHHHGAVLSF